MNLSPNFGPRRHGGLPDMVVLHFTAMQSCAAAVERLCDPLAEVSAHYVIDEDGTVLPLVDERMRAWHAGAGGWGDVCDVNSHSIGIELANKGPDSDAPDFADAQIDALIALLKGILPRWSIPPERVIGHSDMAPARKFDPGPYFPWRRLAGAGVAVWPDAVAAPPDLPAPELWSRFVAAAARFGYCMAEDSAAGAPDGHRPTATLRAFRERFGLPAGGALNGQDVAVIESLAARWPCAIRPGQGATS